MFFIFWMLIGTFVAKSQMTITAPNMGAQVNGFGAINSVMSRTADAPHAYRILFPLLLFRAPQKIKIPLYQFFLSVGSGLAFWTLSISTNLVTSLISAVMIASTFRFDYWDWIFEFGAMAAIIGNAKPLIFAWCILFAASRETAVLAPISYILFHGVDKTGVALLAATILTSLIVRLWVGKKKLYCDRVMLRKNLSDLKLWLERINPKNWQPALKIANAASCSQIGVRCGRHLGGTGYAVLADDMTATFLITVMGIVSSVFLGFPNCLPWLALLAAGWTLAIAKETRVFTSVLIPIALCTSKLLGF